jgi:hypothetical protein
MPESARIEHIREAVAAQEAEAERHAIHLRGSDMIRPIVALPLDWVVLNPRSHRIKAQILSHPQSQQLLDDPYSETSQAVVADLLRATEDFDDLKANLLDREQRHPGVVTHAGVLVNANRRAMALRDLGVNHIKVAVLPADVIEREIDELELSLQLERTFQVDYSFTNELLFVDDLIIQYSYSTAQVAQMLSWQARKVEQWVRLLALVRDIIARSDARIPLTYFDDDAPRSALIEADRAYEGLKRTDAAGAQRLLETRLTGLLLGVRYRSLRRVQENFVVRHWRPVIEDAEQEIVRDSVTLLKGRSTAGADIPGLEELGAAEEAPVGVLDLVARTFNDPVVNLPTDGEPTAVDRSAWVEGLRDSMEEAVRLAEMTERQEDRLNAPLQYLKDAVRALEGALDAHRDVSDLEQFNSTRYQELVQRAREAVAALVDTRPSAD